MTKLNNSISSHIQGLEENTREKNLKMRSGLSSGDLEQTESLEEQNSVLLEKCEKLKSKLNQIDQEEHYDHIVMDRDQKWDKNRQLRDNITNMIQKLAQASSLKRNSEAKKVSKSVLKKEDQEMDKYFKELTKKYDKEKAKYTENEEYGRVLQAYRTVNGRRQREFEELEQKYIKLKGRTERNIMKMKAEVKSSKQRQDKLKTDISGFCKVEDLEEEKAQLDADFTRLEEENRALLSQFEEVSQKCIRKEMQEITSLNKVSDIKQLEEKEKNCRRELVTAQDFRTNTSQVFAAGVGGIRIFSTLTLFSALLRLIMA
ncbi:hypothetical protein WMY93_008880 [Mugilogobius chulae]|uniref:Uncharacterized protein n=1 Tax=Mugilogobius chulae TaxID=88201 RepID=A0AAW0P9V9_9GOBI